MIFAGLVWLYWIQFGCCTAAAHNLLSFLIRPVSSRRSLSRPRAGRNQAWAASSSSSTALVLLFVWRAATVTKVLVVDDQACSLHWRCVWLTIAATRDAGACGWRRSTLLCDPPALRVANHSRHQGRRRRPWRGDASAASLAGGWGLVSTSKLLGAAWFSLGYNHRRCFSSVACKFRHK